MSSNIHLARPVMTLMRCETVKPMVLERLSSSGIEDDTGAAGIGVDVVDGEPMLFVSLHTGERETLIARFDLDGAQAFVGLLIRTLGDFARNGGGGPAEHMN